MADNTERPFTAASYNQYLKENRLMGSRCAQCGKLHLPPRALCPACHSQQLAWIELSGKGRLAAFTSIFIAPNAMAKAGYGKDNPYVSGIVELQEGLKISARILGLDSRQPANIAIGTPLTVDFIAQGEGQDAAAVLAFRA
jgi:uncharacterized OB-fold protein